MGDTRLFPGISAVALLILLGLEAFAAVGDTGVQPEGVDIQELSNELKNCRTKASLAVKRIFDEEENCIPCPMYELKKLKRKLAEYEVNLTDSQVKLARLEAILSEKNAIIQRYRVKIPRVTTTMTTTSINAGK